MTGHAHHRHYVPAAGHDWLLPFYDPLWRLLGGDAVRRDIVEQAEIGAGTRVLDIGCGTGGLTLLIAKLHPDAEVVGLDPDPKALARAQDKAGRASVAVRFDRGFSDGLPYETACFDRVFSSFMLHHLSSDEKRDTLAEGQRVLAPAGSLHVVDFGGTQERPNGILARMLHSGEHMKDNFGGRLLELMREAGFADATETGGRKTFLGPMATYRASAT